MDQRLHVGRNVHRHATGVTYRKEALGDLVEIYATAFSDMHRELYRLYPSGNVVVVRLALQGTHDGPLVLPTGAIPPTGRSMDARCCDVFELVDGKVMRCDCYPSGTVIMAQLGSWATPTPSRPDATATFGERA